MSDMMTPVEFDSILSLLNLQSDEAAQLLGVTTRTLRRWQEGEAIPQTAEAALRAWAKLEDLRIPWKPDMVSILADDRDQIMRMREHAIDVEGMIERVRNRNGPQQKWAVDFGKGEAIFGPMRVTFYHLANGGFSLQGYSRRDDSPDVRRDAQFIEDAAFFIAEGYQRHEQQAAALREVAASIRKNAPFHVRHGAAMDSPKQTRVHVDRINDIARRVDELADEAEQHRASYGAFQRLLDEVHNLSCFPDLPTVSAVAEAFN